MDTLTTLYTFQISIYISIHAAEKTVITLTTSASVSYLFHKNYQQSMNKISKEFNNNNKCKIYFIWYTFSLNHPLGINIFENLMFS